MATKRVTLADVARAAGVSPTTASFVLNGRPAAIPPSTQQRVLAAARRFGYRPHAAARALATGRTTRIGIVLNAPESFGAGDTYFMEVLAGITEGALKHNHNLLLHAAHYPDWRSLFSDIVGGASDGVLLVGRFAGDELTPALLEYGFPAVCLSYHIDHPRCVSVDGDNVEGGALAARHLLELGHRTFLLVYPGDNVSWGAERRWGFEQELEAAGISPEAVVRLSWEENALPSPNWVHEAVTYYVRLDPRPTAVVVCDERRASMFAEALPQAGIRVPEDCSVVSFNSTEISARCRPPLTSVWQPLRQIGATGVDLLMDLIKGRDLLSRAVRLPVRLDVRGSSSVPGKGRNMAA